ncbi:MAG: tetratricopeptide repeat protein [Deltaproteobacteria bacterium]|nr:tetratricopeptide repeat protein [Deltaproteobacteria bacterium]
MKTGDCKKAQNIWLADQDRRSCRAKLLDMHLKDCPSCRLEFEVYELAQLGDSCRPAPKLDELRRRRWLDAALENAQSSNPQSDRQSPRRTHRIKRQLVVGAIAAGVIFASILSFLLMESKQEAKSPTIRTGPVESNGRVLLLAGKAEISGSSKSNDGEIRAGQRLKTADGHAAISLAQGISLVVESDTNVSVDCINAKRVGVTLHSGHILAEVNPERKGAPFSIDTPAGRIVVTGTALGVTVAGATAWVEVYRGSVLLEEKDGTNRRLGFGKRSELSQTAVHNIDEEQMKAAAGQMRIVGLLDDSKGATLNVESSPSGALVLLDDIVVGRTPFHAVLRPGHRTLALELDGYDSIRELIDLFGDTARSRAFLLSKSDKEQEKPPLEIHEASPLLPETLLGAARKHRKAGRWQKAETAYKALIRNYPKRAEARSSLVSLGFIQLEHLKRPDKALRSYNLYLKRAPGGPLAQEAAFGRAMALKALGRRQAEIEALERFVEQYPNAAQSNRARKRLSMLE